MSTDTPLPDDETREHATEPAEGAEGTAATDGADVREHASEPAEGEDV
ncbi:hypothetical protein [Cellulomonas humilata]|uniref:Uncharacterized protein n=1 Tax=Cellulomonas humilata TaxID=144055 RepID=A0ABU0EDQ4_9CELL|nr:hypothetical protein [Cellulomonas humilata]MDQ0373396.1 hypothetical protein [Cellulomonas humilata]